MPPKILRLGSLADFGDAVRQACADGGSPPAATVVVHARLAHRVRAAAGRLAGALFRTAPQCAEDVLLGRGIARRGGAEHFGPLAVEAVLAAGALPRPLRYFRLEQLQAGAGYAEAIARALDELAWAGFAPDDLDDAASGTGEGRGGRLADLATLWRALSDRAGGGHERTSADLLAEAGVLLRRHPEAWPFPGPTLAWVTEETPGAVSRFLGTIPGLRLAYLPAFPVRPETRRRLGLVARSLGASPRALADPAPSRGRRRPGPPERELDLLKSWLLRPPPYAREARPASRGPDGSVALEEHVGVEEELAAAVDWAAAQVLERGRPLEEVALLLPTLDPLAGMLLERLRALDWAAGARDAPDPPAHVAPRGLPAAASAPGARLVALLECLRADVSAASLGRLAPYLRLDPPAGGREHLSHAAAVEAVWSCGTLGGLAGRPEGASEWSPAIARRAADLDGLLAGIPPGPPGRADDPEKSRVARGRPAIERLRDALRGLAPAVRALVSVHELVRTGRPLAEIWPRLREFARAYLPPGGPDLLPRLGEALDPFLRSPFSAEATGSRAVRMLREELSRLRVPEGRFGEPRLFVGTIAAAAGLPFAAVRILGLAEGAFPTRPSVDPILP
ncbi:MAG: hypothetical protein L0216_19115, partial [Planctomycetales bacterium]|nr:hypothetical protein [Planctomycetales bacterium]